MLDWSGREIDFGEWTAYVLIADALADIEHVIAAASEVNEIASTADEKVCQTFGSTNPTTDDAFWKTCGQPLAFQFTNQSD